MLGISLCTEAQAQRGLTAYLRSHRGKNRAEIQIQADLVNNANLGLSSGSDGNGNPVVGAMDSHMAEKRKTLLDLVPRLTLLLLEPLSFCDLNKASSPTPSEPREKRTLTALAPARGH